VTGEGGQDFAYREVTAWVLPVVDFKVEPNLVMLPDQPAKAFNFSRYGTSYLWDFGDGTTSIEEEIEHFYTELGVYDVSLTVWTEHNCEASKILPEAVTVIGKGEVKFPNVFAPNLNGSSGGDYDPTDKSNQVFFPVHDGVMEYKLQIFSRWGEMIFESTDVNVGWDGYYKGHLCDQGVYIWRVSGKYSNGRYFQKAGDVTVLHHKTE
jgi:PKD repeat protein